MLCVCMYVRTNAFLLSTEPLNRKKPRPSTAVVLHVCIISILLDHKHHWPNLKQPIYDVTDMM